MTDNDGFELLEINKRGCGDADTVVAAVYTGPDKSHQLNIKIGSEILNKLNLSAGDRVELRYNRKTRQIKLSQGDAGYTIRADGNFRRARNRVDYLEPFKAVPMKGRVLEVVSLDENAVIVQIPEDIEYD